MRHRSPIQRKKPGTPEPSAPTRLDLASPPVEFAVPSGVPEVLTASGHPLDSTTQEQLSAQFGHDFSQVRVHTDERAAASAQALDARAYTVGQDLVFGASEYAPTTQSGQWLIAHELAHVTQQAAMPTPTTPLAKRLTISQPGDLLEQEADAAADRVVNGHPPTTSNTADSPPPPLPDDADQLPTEATGDAADLDALSATDEMSAEAAVPIVQRFAVATPPPLIQRKAASAVLPGADEDEDVRRRFQQHFHLAVTGMPTDAPAATKDDHTQPSEAAAPDTHPFDANTQAGAPDATLERMEWRARATQIAMGNAAPHPQPAAESPADLLPTGTAPETSQPDHDPAAGPATDSAMLDLATETAGAPPAGKEEPPHPAPSADKEEPPPPAPSADAAMEQPDTSPPLEADAAPGVGGDTGASDEQTEPAEPTTEPADGAAVGDDGSGSTTPEASVPADQDPPTPAALTGDGIVVTVSGALEDAILAPERVLGEASTPAPTQETPITEALPTTATPAAPEPALANPPAPTNPASTDPAPTAPEPVLANPPAPTDPASTDPATTAPEPALATPPAPATPAPVELLPDQPAEPVWAQPDLAVVTPTLDDHAATSSDDVAKPDPRERPFHGIMVQPKLAISTPGDPYEHEADQVAALVLRMPQADAATTPDPDPGPAASLRISRVASALPPPQVSDETDARIQNLSGGQPLPESERDFFESRMGVDLRNVRIHASSDDATTAQELQARAFTVGPHIVFNQGEYQPGSDEGRQLLAHELTHVVQQGAVPQAQRAIPPQIQRVGFSLPNPLSGLIDSLKRSAHRAGQRIKAGTLGAITSLQQAGSSAWNQVSGQATQAWADLQAQGSAAWANVQTTATTLTTQIQAAAGDAWTMIADQGSRAWAKLQESAAGAWDGVQGMAASAADTLTRSASTLLTTLQAGAQEATTSLRTGWSSLQAQASALITGLRSNADTLLDGLRERVGGVVQQVEAGWQGVQTQAGALLTQLQTLTSGLLSGFQSRLGGFASAILTFDANGLAAAWGDLSGFAGEAWQTMQEATSGGLEVLQSGWDNIKTGAVTALAGMGAQGRALLGGLEQQVQGIWGSLQAAWGSLKDGARAALSRLAQQAQAGLTNLKELGTSAWTNLTTLSTAAWTNLKDQGTAAWTTLQTLGTSAWTNLKALGSDAWTNLKALGTSAWTNLKALGTSAWTNLKALGTALWTRLMGEGQTEVASKQSDHRAEESGLRSAAGQVIQWLGAILTGLHDLAGPAINQLSGVAGTVWTTLKSNATGAWTNLQGMATSAWTSLQGMATSAWTNLQGVATSAWTGLKTRATSAWTNLQQFATNAWTGLKTRATSAWTNLQHLATGAWTGLANGWEQLKGMAATAWQGIEGAWDGITQRVGATWSGLKQMLSSGWEQLKGMAATAWQGIQGTWDGLKTTTITGVAAFLQGVQRAWDAIKSFSPGEIIDTLTRVGPFFKSVQAAVADPAQFTDPIIEGVVETLHDTPGEAESQVTQLASEQPTAPDDAGDPTVPVMRQPATAMPVQAERRRASTAEIRAGAWAAIQTKWGQLDAWDIVQQALWDLIWPWPGVAEDWHNLVSALGAKTKQLASVSSLETLATAISHLIDIPLILWRTVNSILGRLSGWFTVASVVGGAIVGAFFGGVGAIPGALAGVQVAGTVGLGLGLSAGGELLVSAQKAFLDLYGVPQTPEEQDEDYDQLGTSAIGLAVLVVLLALAWIVSRIVGAIVQAVGKTRFGQWARTTWDDLRRPGARGSDGETTTPSRETEPGKGETQTKEGVQEVQEWAKDFDRKSTPNNTPRDAYEIKHTGPDNIQIQGGGEEIFADGLRPETRTILEAKFIEKPERSPFIENSNIPEFLRKKITADVEDEFRRYAAVINDPATPVTNLEVIVSSPDAVPFFEGLLQKYNIPGHVVVKE